MRGNPFPRLYYFVSSHPRGLEISGTGHDSSPMSNIISKSKYFGRYIPLAHIIHNKTSRAPILTSKYHVMFKDFPRDT